MAFKLIWDAVGERLYETGADRGVLYLPDPSGIYNKGVVWNGLISVAENPSGGEPTALWADNQKYLNLMSTEEYAATIEAYTYPDEFAECDGSRELAPGIIIGQQTRKGFGFAYRTLIGNDQEAAGDLGYKIHLVYGALATPSDRTSETVNDTPDAITFSWDLSTTPVNVTGMKPTASLVVDSTKVEATTLAEIEAILYGDGTTEPRLPLPDEIVELMTP